MAETKTKAAPPDSKTQPATHQTQLKKVRMVCAAAVFIIALALYLFTLAPTVTLVDSGELILAARSLGVAHPPGFPLYLLLAHAATYLPVGDIATRVHLVSALFAALTTAVMSLLAGEMVLNVAAIQQATHKQKQGRKKKGKGSPTEADAVADDQRGLLFVIVPSLVAGLLMAFSRTLWAYATIAEVYTLNTFLIVTIVFLMLSWRRAKLNVSSAPITTIAKGTGEDKKLYVAAFLFGLALGVHHVTVGLLLPALAALVLATAGWQFFKSKRLLYATLCAFLGLGIYIYLPIAAARAPLMNWGDPQTAERFWWHITGKQYQVFFDLSPERISEFLRLTLREFSYPWLPLAVLLSVAGFVHLFKRDRAMFIFLSLIVTADVIYCLGYEIAEDKDAYYLPAFVALTVAAAAGVRWLLLFLQATKLRAVPVPVRLASLLLLPALAFASNFPFNNRSRYFIAHDYVTNILNSVEPRGLLLTNDWQVYSPLLYVHHIENTRSDVVAVDVNQLRRSWYFDYLKQVYPDLIANSGEKVEAFLEDLRGWEHDPDAYARSAALAERINTRFYDMLLAFVTSHIKDAPVYVTQDVALNRGGPNQELTAALTEKYKLIPQGLIFRVSESATLPEAEEKPLVTRGLADHTLKFESDDVVMQKVYPVYLAMLTNRGRYLALQNRHEKAAELFKQALTIDASYEPAQRALTASQGALQKTNSPK